MQEAAVTPFLRMAVVTHSCFIPMSVSSFLRIFLQMQQPIHLNTERFNTALQQQHQEEEEVVGLSLGQFTL
jgi:hypothetical protein